MLMRYCQDRYCRTMQLIPHGVGKPREYVVPKPVFAHRPHISVVGQRVDRGNYQ